MKRVGTKKHKPSLFTHDIVQSFEHEISIHSWQVASRFPIKGCSDALSLQGLCLPLQFYFWTRPSEETRRFRLFSCSTKMTLTKTRQTTSTENISAKSWSLSAWSNHGKVEWPRWGPWSRCTRHKTRNRTLVKVGVHADHGYLRGVHFFSSGRNRLLPGEQTVEMWGNKMSTQLFNARLVYRYWQTSCGLLRRFSDLGVETTLRDASETPVV